MTPKLLGPIAFIEGFASLGIEVIALRRLVPHLGSSISVTAPTIGLFLLALSLGYWQGGRVRKGEMRRVMLNFSAAALIAGVGLSSAAMTLIFGATADPWVAYLFFMGAVVCPAAWCLAQTVPLLANVCSGMGAGRASGLALTASTFGSVLGAVSLSWGVMQTLGVSAAVLVCAGSLGAGVVFACLRRRRWAPALAMVAAMVAMAALNLRASHSSALESAYADYRVDPVPADQTLASGRTPPERVFLVNRQRASQLDADEPARRASYIERMHQHLARRQWSGQSILVLGAGGFTLSLQDPANHYTYVDIDPRIKEVAQEHFLKAPVTGRFIAEDARRHVAQTSERHRAVVVDVFSAHASVPAHLVTLEFWRSLTRVLEADGVVLINLILDSRLQSAYARNVLATVEAGLGRCATEVLDPLAPISNVVLICQPGMPPQAAPASIYTDELNRVDLDRGRLGF